MKLTHLKVNDILRIKAVDVTPTGNVVKVIGRNAQGKTSLLRAIQMAFGGKRAQPAEAIREGADEGTIIASTEDFTIELRLQRETKDMKAGSVLEVRSRAGARIPSPQSMLDKLVSALSFDPLAFMNLPPKEKAEQLRRLVGLDFREHDAQHAAIFAERTATNRDVKSLEARVPPAVDDAPEKPVDAKALMAEATRLETNAREFDILTGDVTRLAQAVTAAEAALQRAKDQLADARRRLEAAPAVDSALLKAKKQQVVDAAAKNLAYERAQSRAKLLNELSMLHDKAEDQTAQLAELDAEKARKLAAAKFPIDGLAFTDTGVTFKGLPLENASGAEQLRVSVAIGLALNPKLKVLLVKDASLLDADSQALLAQMAQEADAQVWCEVVGTEGVGIIIEDGTSVDPGLDDTDTAPHRNEHEEDERDPGGR